MRIIVVGAGVFGTSVAYHLARVGAEVIIIDRADKGRATAAGAGIICPWLSDTGDAPFAALYAGGARYYPALVDALGGADAVGYHCCGALYVSRSSAELVAVERLAQSWTPRAPEIGAIDHLSATEARRLFPPLARDLGAVRIGGGARVDGRRLATALLAAAERCGARSLHGTAALMHAGSRVFGVRSNDSVLEADRVVVTAGAWAPTLLEPIGVALPIQPQRGQILHLELPGCETRDWPVVLPPGAHYLLAFGGGRIVAGATRENGTGFENRVTAGGQAELLREALDVAPGLAEATVVETRVGFRPVASSVRPLLGMVRGVEGLAIGNGLGAGGLTMGPYAGKLLAEAVLGEPSLDLAPYDPLRVVEPNSLALR